MAQNLTTANDLLKQKYLPGVADEFSSQLVLMQRLRKQKNIEMDANGRYYIYALASSPNEGIGSAADGDVLPTTGAVGYAIARLKRTHHYGGWSISGPLLDAMKGEGAVIDFVDKEVNSLLKRMRRDKERMAFNDGSGLLAVIDGTTSSGAQTTLKLQTSPQYANAPGAQNLVVGMKVDVLLRSTGATALGVAGATVTAVDKVSVPNTVTLSAATAGTVTTSTLESNTVMDYGIFRAGSRNLEMWGLTAICSKNNPGKWSGLVTGAPTTTIDGTELTGYGGIDRTTAANAYWKGQEFNNTGSSIPNYGYALTTKNRALRQGSWNLVQTAIDQASTEQDANTSLIITSKAIVRQIGMRGNYNRIVNDGNLKLINGWTGLMWGEIPILGAPLCPPNTMFGLDESTFDYLVERELSSMNEDGNTMVRTAVGTSAKDEYEARFIERSQLGCNKPGANWMITDISETSDWLQASNAMP